jgi:hypothetical protein
MNLAALNPLLSQIPFPISKANIVQFAQQQGASDQVIGLLQRLPEKIFQSPLEVQNALGGLGNLGGLGGLKL